MHEAFEFLFLLFGCLFMIAATLGMIAAIIVFGRGVLNDVTHRR
jgi:hypothetical protein